MFSYVMICGLVRKKVKMISVSIGLKNLYSVDIKYRGEVLSPMYQKEEKVTF